MKSENVFVGIERFVIAEAYDEGEWQSATQNGRLGLLSMDQIVFNRFMLDRVVLGVKMYPVDLKNFLLFRFINWNS